MQHNRKSSSYRTWRTAYIRQLRVESSGENLLKALKRVESNAGAPGVDKMKTTQLRGYIRRHWGKIKAALLEGRHKPLPVLRKGIPKEGGGIRLLGIPTVLVRLIQQAMVQVLTDPQTHRRNPSTGDPYGR